MSTTDHGLLRGRRAVVAFASVALVLAFPQPALASVSAAADSTPNVNGTVYAIAQVGDLTIIGGDFTRVGGRTRLHAAAIRSDGTLDPNFDPAPNGSVRAIAGSADGGTVFLGGTFSTAGGAARANLAAVDASTGTAVVSWQADTTGGSPGVRALATAADRLYVGGTFSGIDGTGRASLVALDAAAGNLISSFHPRANAGITAIRASSDGAKVYAGGAFSRIGGQIRSGGAAELWTSTGDATAFNPSEFGDRTITIGLSPDDSRLYFSTPNNYVFAYDLDSNVPVWVRKTSGDTQAIAVSATDVYIGGHFSQVVTYKIKRSFLASLNAADGTVTGWDPNPQGGRMGVWAITLTPTSAMAGGTFTTVGDEEQVRFARFPGTP